jgi:hypothetical protein
MGFIKTNNLLRGAIMDLKNNQNFIEWMSERKGLVVEGQDEAILTNFWNEYQREIEYDAILGF